MNQTTNKIGIEATIAVISEHYHLEVRDLAETLEAIGYITPEQGEMAVEISSAFTAKAVIDNRVKGVKA